MEAAWVTLLQSLPLPGGSKGLSPEGRWPVPDPRTLVLSPQRREFLALSLSVLCKSAGGLCGDGTGEIRTQGLAVLCGLRPSGTQSSH